MRFLFGNIKKKFREAIEKWSPQDSAIVLTLILLFFFTESALQIDILVKFAALAGLLFYRLALSPFYWLYLSVILIVGHTSAWQTIDNHIYLMTYWCLALSVSLFAKNSALYIQSNARVLIGLCFLFAVFWKLITPEFTNGTFFQFLLAGGDIRFQEFSIFISGMTPEMIESNRKVINEVKSVLGAGELQSLTVSADLDLFTHLLTWWTLLLEGAIAFSFLKTGNHVLFRYRNFLLLIFILSTYPIASVIGFAWLLVAMGIAQISNHERRYSVLYIVVFILLGFFISDFTSRLYLF